MSLITTRACYIQYMVLSIRIRSVSDLQRRDRERSVIEGAHIHIFGFISRENNQFQKKPMRQNPNI